MSFGAERFAAHLLSEASRKNSSDIHLIPRGEEMLIQFRIQGDLVHFRTLSYSSGERLISHLKFKASLDIGDKRKPQSGAFTAHINEDILSLRVSTLPASSFKESLVIRLLPQAFSVPIERLSLFSKPAKQLLSLVHYSHGMILFTGPTGSGKTTTLYSLIQYCATHLNRNIITLEDPIERQQDHILQVQINERAGVTYAAGLKAVLRHDPDIIIIGEIRDPETAQIAARAALSGHLVLSTLHAKNAEGAVYRMLDLGVSKEELTQTLIGVTGQRLVKVNRSKPEIARATIFEVLTGKILQSVLSQTERGLCRHDSINKLLLKGVALGYVSTEEYYRWMEQETDDTAKTSGLVSEAPGRA
ncbi:competence type IV pilus ATPase ComGA [Jeotgalibacillus proteolyticus]|uniref:Competence protein ComG n=1 Tax=Jeotgalibacillus proteolyticus TaxID=2082395 RepID=A0A2S5GEC3_9BACL|nr:competence type IV pilus ATPase ComGA [Jeotgalibacillus proteolyticus]PPA71402.1 competence protein ComG [Jeotgalibacillus proteolyticus]